MARSRPLLTEARWKRRQALLLGLSINLYHLRHRYLFLRMSTEPNSLYNLFN
jgi:hypothetical protein